jgi:CheY-like chemotaxis protein
VRILGLEGEMSHILVADDDVTLRALFARQLLCLKHTCDCVTDGAQAVKAFSEKRYPMILMDVCMPNVDGLAATRLIRAFEIEHHYSPCIIVAVTACINPDDCYTAGMNGFLRKPVRLNELQQICVTWL